MGTGQLAWLVKKYIKIEQVPPLQGSVYVLTKPCLNLRGKKPCLNLSGVKLSNNIDLFDCTAQS